MIGDLSIAKLAFEQSSNSVGTQLAEARLGLEAADAAATTGRDTATAPGNASNAPPPEQQNPPPRSLMVKVLDRKA